MELTIEEIITHHDVYRRFKAALQQVGVVTYNLDWFLTQVCINILGKKDAGLNSCSLSDKLGMVEEYVKERDMMVEIFSPEVQELSTRIPRDVILDGMPLGCRALDDAADALDALRHTVTVMTSLWNKRNDLLAIERKRTKE